MTKKKLLVICGPTATGKTKLAIFLAKKLGAELISADSRQVYKEMDIGTGKDLPLGAQARKTPRLKEISYYLVDGVKIWGYDLADPKEEFSVSQYLFFAQKILEDIYSRGKLPILVGGTGFYIKALVDGLDTAQIPKNKNLRQILENCSTNELYEKLSIIDPVKAASLNACDRKNLRRLIRAIEVAQSKIYKDKPSEDLPYRGISADADILFIGLYLDSDKLKQKIVARARVRVKAGIKEEIRELTRVGVNWDMQSMTSLGYRQWKDYFLGKISETEVFKIWVRDEIKYAKRQMTWFKRDPRIVWFDVSKNLQGEVERFVKKWYDLSNEPKN